MKKRMLIAALSVSAFLLLSACGRGGEKQGTGAPSAGTETVLKSEEVKKPLPTTSPEPTSPNLPPSPASKSGESGGSQTPDAATESRTPETNPRLPETMPSTPEESRTSDPASARQEPPTDILTEPQTAVPTEHQTDIPTEPQTPPPTVPRTNPPAPSPTRPRKPVTYLTPSEIQRIVEGAVGQVTIEEMEAKLEKNPPIYEVEAYRGESKYEFEIHAVTGVILEFEEDN